MGGERGRGRCGRGRAWAAACLAPPLHLCVNKGGEGGQGSLFIEMTTGSPGEAPQKQDPVSYFLPLKTRKEEKGGRKKEKDREIGGGCSSLISALAKMDPGFIFNHARPRPICLVYSAGDGLGGDHYLDTRLTNEARPGRRLCCCGCWKTAWIFFLCPPPDTPRKHPLTAR